ncbi:MAG: hypothetical protein HC898_04930 [Phycisphaerales bacterium]|nr:hypothetical protein [Phycisphaerales bacterium]
MSDTPIQIEQQDGVTTLWLNRPDKRNAFTQAMWAAFPALLEQAIKSRAWR